MATPPAPSEWGQQVWVVPPERLLLDDVAVQHHRLPPAAHDRCAVLLVLRHKLLGLANDHGSLWWFKSIPKERQLLDQVQLPTEDES